jgi:hypothetical protein
MAHKLDQNIIDLLSKNGEMHTNEIIVALPDHKERNVKSRLSKLKSEGTIDMPRRSVWCLTPTSTQTPPNQQLNEISEALRSADANKVTIDKLMNLYDSVLDNYTTWVADNVGSHTDFEKQLLFIENFKWLTAIGDKLMKRWSLEHVGYDTNTRQAQEDAKAKTQEREKAALEDAPLEEQVNVIGSFDLDTKQLIDALPTLESLTKKEEEEIKV